MAKERRPKQIYREVYKPGAMMVQKELLPEQMPYMADGFRVDDMEILAAGHMEDGREFQEVRVYSRFVGKSAPARHDPNRPIPLVGPEEVNRG